MESVTKRNPTRTLNIALIGYGVMGKEVERAALARGHQILAKIDPNGPDLSINRTTLQNAEVCIEFTHPDQVVENIRKAAQEKRNLVVGTTGWHDRVEEVKQIVKAEGIGLIYAPNFALGVYLFQKLAEEAAKIMNNYEEFDVGIVEFHHKFKKDAPSGGAFQLGNTLLKHLKRKKRLVTHVDGAIDPEEIHVSSVRAGHIPGTHTLVFDSPVEGIEITHTSRGKQGFANGAVKAAEWIADKVGFYTLDDLYGGI